MSPASRARACKRRHPGWTPTQIAAHIGSTRQAVEAALAVTHARPGRPEASPTRVVRLSAELLRRASRDARRGGVKLRAWLEHAIAIKLVGTAPTLPPGVAPNSASTSGTGETRRKST